MCESGGSHEERPQPWEPSGIPCAANTVQTSNVFRLASSPGCLRLPGRAPGAGFGTIRQVAAKPGMDMIAVPYERQAQSAGSEVLLEADRLTIRFGGLTALAK